MLIVADVLRGDIGRGLCHRRRRLHSDCQGSYRRVSEDLGHAAPCLCTCVGPRICVGARLRSRPRTHVRMLPRTRLPTRTRVIARLRRRTPLRTPTHTHAHAPVHFPTLMHHRLGALMAVSDPGASMRFPHRRCVLPSAARRIVRSTQNYAQ